MRTAEAFIDANLLVLLVVGSVDRDQVGKHRRTRRFTSEDYDRLARTIEALKSVFVTPNVLTEASNLLESKSDQRYLNMLKDVIQKSEEIVVSSATAVRNRSFSRLGLTDAVLLDVVSKKRPLLTVDLDLFISASKKEDGSAFNFTHYQGL